MVLLSSILISFHDQLLWFLFLVANTHWKQLCQWKQVMPGQKYSHRVSGARHSQLITKFARKWKEDDAFPLQESHVLSIWLQYPDCMNLSIAMPKNYYETGTNLGFWKLVFRSHQTLTHAKGQCCSHRSQPWWCSTCPSPRRGKLGPQTGNKMYHAGEGLPTCTVRITSRRGLTWFFVVLLYEMRCCFCILSRMLLWCWLLQILRLRAQGNCGNCCSLSSGP